MTFHQKPSVRTLPGFLDAGKAALLDHDPSNRKGRRAAVAVNDICVANTDMELAGRNRAGRSRTEGTWLRHRRPLHTASFHLKD